MHRYLFFIYLTSLFFTTTIIHAGIFDLPGFVEPKKWSIGLEPEIIISTPTGAGFNFKPRYGVNNLLNIEGIIGTGTGYRNFRTGGIADFDWFPDIGNPLGIATPIFISYNRIQANGALTYGAEPLFYKTFHEKNGADYTLFFSLPIGWDLRHSTNQSFVQFAIGSMFKLVDLPRWRFTIESGFGITNSFSYLSGGFTYYQ